ncbi:RNA polymerase sigma factor [Micropruina sp.]|uniref:RNA polymerase sigma factor n=1 Tax=Micropruina sp. TaxID=2737536 RepID=UPI0039E5C5A4
MGVSPTEFEALYRANAAGILAYLRRRGADDDAPDLLSETFLTAWRRRDALPTPELRRAWLFSTARRLRLAHQRRNPPTTMITDLAARTQDASDTDTDTETNAIVRAALDKLTEADRELLTLTIWEGLTPSEAAATIGISAPAARVRLHRARRRIAADPALAAHLETHPRDEMAPSPAGLGIAPQPG